jgi:hypothetical protein
MKPMNRASSLSKREKMRRKPFRNEHRHGALTGVALTTADGSDGVFRASRESLQRRGTGRAATPPVMAGVAALSTTVDHARQQDPSRTRRATATNGGSNGWLLLHDDDLQILTVGDENSQPTTVRAKK